MTDTRPTSGVYAVMRGTQLVELYARSRDAEEKVVFLNAIFRTGKRHTVVPMPVK